MAENIKVDIVVAGAGIAGISAAIKAAKLGSKVLLLEHFNFLGGMSTAGMVSPFMKHSINNEPLVKGVFEEIEIEMQSENGMIDNGFYANSFRSSVFALLKRYKVSILVNCEIISINKIDDKIISLITNVSGITHEIFADLFIDTTGDAQLAYLGGFPYSKGDEKTGKLQALTLFFRMGGIDIPKALDYVKQNKNDFFNWMDFDFDLNKIISVAGYFSNIRRAIEENRISPELQYIFYTTLPESGEASFNTTNILGLDASNSIELTQAELIGREQVKQITNILLNEIPGFENSYLLETALQVGVRETRRVIGDYIVTGEDIKKGRKFNDSIARACYGIDIHGQKDESSVMDDLPEGEYYEIPMHALIVKEAKNLLAAGRCISATREGHGALRIMPTSSATGEACGVIASIAAKNKYTDIREVKYEQVKTFIKGNITER